ncbi:RNA-directed DNA polymerase from mobile element jockey [Trichonephila clavipes]|nr:RNA-directed DNA polymerase from mobile element jockey [Trichonephila clavipes]
MTEITKNVRERLHDSKISLTSSTKSKRNRVRRFWQRSRDPALKNELRTISNEIASDIRHLSRASWEKPIKELSPKTEQHGFVTKSSTVTQLLRVTELLHTGFQNHQATGMLFGDIAKAFDKIWHDGLISKMMRLGFSDQILKIIHSYLNSREFRVRVENCLSSLRPVKSGIPQGSLLEPRLFNLYINDIPKADNVHSAMYADDTAIISQHTCNFKIIEILQNYITRLQLWLVAWKIKVNESKSASLLFTKQRL